MRKLTRQIRTRATCVDPSLLVRAHCAFDSTTTRAAEIDWKIFEDLRRRQKISLWCNGLPSRGDVDRERSMQSLRVPRRLDLPIALGDAQVWM